MEFRQRAQRLFNTVVIRLKPQANGHVLVYAPADPDGLWLRHSVAMILNARDAGNIREGFTTELFNYEELKPKVFFV